MRHFITDNRYLSSVLPLSLRRTLPPMATDFGNRLRLARKHAKLTQMKPERQSDSHVSRLGEVGRRNNFELNNGKPLTMNNGQPIISHRQQTSNPDVPALGGKSMEPSDSAELLLL